MKSALKSEMKNISLQEINTCLFPVSHASPPPSSHCSDFCQQFCFFLDFISTDSYKMLSFMVGLFYLIKCFQESSLCGYQYWFFCSILLSIIPWYELTTICFPFFCCRTFWVVFSFYLL